MLELACRHPKIAGKVILEQWKQGTELWNRVETPLIMQNRDTGQSQQANQTAKLPHRPYAFFTLLPNQGAGKTA